MEPGEVSSKRVEKRIHLKGRKKKGKTEKKVIGKSFTMPLLSLNWFLSRTHSPRLPIGREEKKKQTVIAIIATHLISTAWKARCLQLYVKPISTFSCQKGKLPPHSRERPGVPIVAQRKQIHLVFMRMWF